MKKKNCRFCSIGKENAFIIGENEFAIAVLDKHPITRGHSLVIPKRHVEKIWQLKDKEIVALMRLYFKVARKIMKVTKHKGFWLRHNYHPYLKESKLVVRHVHFHVVPRTHGDDVFKQLLNTEGIMRIEPSLKELEALAKKLR